MLTDRTTLMTCLCIGMGLLWASRKAFYTSASGRMREKGNIRNLLGENAHMSAKTITQYVLLAHVG